MLRQLGDIAGDPSGLITRQYRCPLYPQKRTSPGAVAMSALCQKQTHAAQQNGLFDHLVGASRQRRRYFDPQCFGSLEVDGELEVGGQQERKITRFLAL